MQVAPRDRAETPDPPPESVASLFERVAAKEPGATAIRHTGGSLTYAQLNSWANRIARALLAAAGPCPGRIALPIDQGPGAIAASLAALKLGHAFVPLEVAAPPARLRSIIEDCEPAAVARSGDPAAWLDPTIPAIAIDGLREGPDEPNPGQPVMPDAIAYILFTSGSTGQPKGVCQTHGNLLHFVRVYSDNLDITREDRLSLLYSPAFSASNMDVFGALLRGATLCPFNIRQNGIAGLADWLDAQAITVLHCVPTVFRHLTQSVPRARRLRSVRAIDLGGETVFPSDVALHQDHFAEDSALYNHLAATEASVIAQCRIDGTDFDPARPMPVGYPAEGIHVTVNPIGGTGTDRPRKGELMIHSRFLSPGYWRRPDLDERAFTEDPARPGWRIFRSGDQGYFGDDGRLYFIGRKDLRIKIRGHTIDTAEIEMALRAIPGIADAVAVSRPARDARAPDELVAYVRFRDSAAVPPNEIRGALRKGLPPQMIPAHIITLDSLPVTTTGKIDRAALAASDLRETAIGPAPPPETKLERQIANIFKEILHRDAIGRDDDFFLSGGDSLKATQLLIALEGILGSPFPPAALIRNATVAGIARAAWGPTPSSGPDPALISLRETGSHPPLFLMHGRQGLAFVSPHFIRVIGAQQPLYAFHAPGLHQDRVRHQSVGRMADAYIRAMRRARPSGPYFLGALCAGCVVAIEMAKKLRASGERVGPLLLIDPTVTPPGELPWPKRLKRLLSALRRRFLLTPAEARQRTRRLRRMQSLGRIAAGPENGPDLSRAIRVGLDFEIALLRHRMTPYDGDVLLLSSRAREKRRRASRHKTIADFLVGKTEIFEVSAKHGDVHDIHNEVFARELARSVQSAVSAMGSDRTHPAASQDLGPQTSS